jgi:nitrogen fixation protein FixH
MTGEFTGRHMAAVMVGGFGLVIGINLVMASLAGATFGGVVVENSYVASQKFNTWLGKAQRARELGWEIGLAWSDGGRLLVETGRVPEGGEVSGTARHPLGREEDRSLHFTDAGNGTFLSREGLPAGRWTVRLEIRAGGETWRDERDVK